MKSKKSFAPGMVEVPGGGFVDIRTIKPGSDQAKAFVTQEAVLIEEDLTRLFRIAKTLGCWDLLQALIDRCASRT